ncbi:MAG: UvrB/UvrC motif-containing protein [Planctomycetaceae bacterium]|jgi:protein arginine kinase activator
MKKCRRCTKTATIHVTEVRDGKGTAVHLCESCAREYLEKNATAEAALAVAAEAVEAHSEAESAPSNIPPCPHCGISFAEFRENGRFGCPQDYTHFHSELQPLLENIHEDVKHLGKQPRRLLIGTQDQARLVQLRTSQREAIEQENYEHAARLRDEIAGLEARLKQPAEPAN